MASHLFRSACFGVQKGEMLVSTTPVSYHYQSMTHVNRPTVRTNTIIKCILHSVNLSLAVESVEVVDAATDGICP